jgi:hypothetical protein
MEVVPMGAMRQQGTRRLRLGVWTSVFVVSGLLAIAGGAFAVGRSTAPDTSPMAYSQSQMSTGMSRSGVTPWVRRHSDSITWMRSHMAGVTWLRDHEGQWRRMRDDPSWRWMSNHMHDVMWIRHHLDEWRWARTHPRSWQRIRGHMGDMMPGR